MRLWSMRKIPPLSHEVIDRSQTKDWRWIMLLIPGFIRCALSAKNINLRNRNQKWYIQWTLFIELLIIQPIRIIQHILPRKFQWCQYFFSKMIYLLVAQYLQRFDGFQSNKWLLSYEKNGYLLRSIIDLSEMKMLIAMECGLCSLNVACSTAQPNLS